ARLGDGCPLGAITLQVGWHGALLRNMKRCYGIFTLRCLLRKFHAWNLRRFVGTACPPSSLCKTGVCNPSVVCPSNPPSSQSQDPRSYSAKCMATDKLTRSICDNAKKICKIADDLNDPWSRDKCEKGRVSCEAALQRSKNCDMVMDCRSGTCIPRPRWEVEPWPPQSAFHRLPNVGTNRSHRAGRVP